jgi:hypothetical protein
MHERTEGALEGLTGLSLADLDASSLVVVLTVVGDALRLDIPLPAEVSKRLRDSLSEASVLDALGALTASVRTWSLPTMPQAEGDDPDVEWALRRRDEVESVLLAARRILLPRNVLVDRLEAAGRLAEALRGHDLSCGRQIARVDAERMLGERIVIVGARSWLDEVPWAEEPAEESGLESPEGMFGAATPSLRTLERYVVRGELRRWVETAAGRSPEVAEELEEMITTYRESRSAGVSFVARLWQSHRAAERAVQLDPPASLDRAAADEATLPTEATRELELGFLDPLDAEATLRVSRSELVLTVFEGSVALRELRFGEVVTTAAREGEWEARVRRDPSQPNAIFELRVTDTQGRTFEAPITVAPDHA